MATCLMCGMPIADGDRHNEQSIAEDGTIIIRCRFVATLGPGWQGRYGRTINMPNQRLHFSKIFDPDNFGTDH
jgi:hypothetical protein